MKKIIHKKSLLLLSIALLTVASVQILNHYVTITDLTNGLMTGVGIGLLVMALATLKYKSV